MIFRIKITEQADSDLRGIFEYIAFDLKSMQNAKGQLSRLEDSIMKLERMPQRFCKSAQEPWQSRGLRIMPVDNYCVFYIPDEQNGVVSIIRVMYGGRDIAHELQAHTKI